MRIPIFQRAAETPWAITEDYLNTILEIAQRQNDKPEAVAAQLGRNLENTYEVEYRDGVAILNIDGPLFRYANLFTEVSGATSYEKVAQDFNAAINDESVAGIVLNIDSPGGEANGTNELAEMIYQARGVKPIEAYVGGKGASGAYWIASAADRITIDETAMLGSIGVRIAMEGRRMESGEPKRYVIVSSQSPNKDMDPESAEDRERIQVVLDDLASVFVAKVARNRGTDEETVLSDFGRGDVMVGSRAIEAGLADRMGSFEGVVAELAERESDGNRFMERVRASSPGGFTPFGSQPGASGYSQPAAGGLFNVGGYVMWLTDKEPAAGEEQRHIEANAANIRQYCPEAVAEIEQTAKASVSTDEATAAEQERERIAAILSCDEANGRHEQAAKLATTPGMTAEQAAEILATIPKGNAFVQEMEAEDQGVGPDAGVGSSDAASIAQGAIEAARSAGTIR